MNTRAPVRDPRSIITPDVFDLSDDLLGIPLASPRRRFVALIIDLAVIGIITVVTGSFALILGVVAAIFFMRAGFKRTPVKGSVFGRAMRLSVGCLGFFIAIITASLWGIFGADFGAERDGPAAGAVNEVLQDAGLTDPLGVLGGFAASLELADAEDLGNARDALDDVVEQGLELGMTDDQVRDMASALIPPDASWRSAAVEYLDELIGGDTEDETATEEGLAEARDEVADLSTEEALREFSAVLVDGEIDPADPRAVALQERVTEDLAGDSIGRLTSRTEDLQRDLTQESRQHAATQAALDEELDGGLFAALRTFVDELGFGFGWASLYLTIFLAWWNGQTIGKRMMGIRVVRLDGEPITWWIGFERAGGYAAGFATGLLGFAQVYWDSNRQAIHDRIVGTVVVVDKAEKVQGWESAL